MPPRFAYWTILVDNQPTSFRASSADDLLPTFNRLKAKNPSAVMMWFQGGKLWPSRLDAQEAMRARGDMGRKGDPKQGDFSRNVEGDGFSRRREDKNETRRPGEKLDWKPKSPNAREVARRDFKPKPYTPKPEFKPESRAQRADLSRRSGNAAKADSWKPKAESGEKPEWKPKGSFKPEFKSKTDSRPEWRAKSFNPKGKSFKSGSRPPRAESWKPKADKPEWKPKGSFEPTPRKPRTDNWKPKAESRKPRADKPEWKPKAESGELKAESREPKAESRPEFRDRKKWRPGGDHQDPRQKYKDAKKAKWTRFKQAIRARSSRPKKNDR